MSMAMAVEGLRDFLQQVLGWDKNQCNIQQGARPPAVANNFYVALDDGGIETGPAENYYLHEIYTIQIAIWVSAGAIPADMSGEVQLQSDRYIPGAATLDSMERSIVGLLHQRQEPRNQINTQFGLPGDKGDVFLRPLIWSGRPTNEVIGVAAAGQHQSPQWLGRRERFRGFDRNSKIGMVR